VTQARAVVLGWQERKKATAGKKGCDAAHVAIDLAEGKRHRGRRLAAQSATFFIPTQPYLEDSLWHCWW
jgi:hypothetical protein